MPGTLQLNDFIGDQNGVDELTTSTAKLKNKGDSITLINPYDGVTAHFKVKYIKKSTVTIWFTSKDQTDVKIKEFSLATGESKIVTNKEETVWEQWGVGGAYKDINIFIELMSYDDVNYKGETETTYILPGEMVFTEGGQWNPKNIMKRVRDRRMLIGPLGPAHYPGRANMAGDPEEREKVLDLVRQGKVDTPLQAAMIRSAYAYDDAKKFKDELPLRPY